MLRYFTSRRSCPRPCQWNRQNPRYATTSGPEIVTVTSAGSTGQITLEIYHGSDDSKLSDQQNGHVLLYLPSGPFHNKPTSNIVPALDFKSANTSLLSRLGRAANAVVVKVNYRLSAQHPYPLSVFDVLAGFDWIVKNLVKETSIDSKSRFMGIDHDTEGHKHTAYKHTRVGVYGENIGGGLALMLALTECKLHSKAGIVAAAVRDPLVDWTFADVGESTSALSSTAKKRRGQQNVKSCPASSPSADSVSGTKQHGASPALSKQSVASLLSLRQVLFPRGKPSAYFSPFASPIHFLRTPAISTPTPSLDLVTNAALTNEGAPDNSSADEEFALLAHLENDKANGDSGNSRISVVSNSAATLRASTPLGSTNSDEILKISTTTNFSVGEEEQSAVSATSPLPPPVTDSSYSPKRFRIPLRYPPSGTGPIAMPDMLFSITSAESKALSNGTNHSGDPANIAALLQPQGEEMVRLLRRAWMKWGPGSEVAAALVATERGTEGEDLEVNERLRAGKISEHVDPTGDWDHDTRNGEQRSRQTRENAILQAVASRKIMLETSSSSESVNAEEIERIGKWFADVLAQEDTSDEAARRVADVLAHQAEPNKNGIEWQR